MSSIPTVQKVWDEMISYGKTIRENSVNEDGSEKMISISETDTPVGLHAWNVIKSDLASMENIVPFKWNEEGILSVMTNNEFSENKDAGTFNVFGERPNSGCDHFLVQHMRIVHKNPDASFTRLMQVAYNIGQLQSCPELLDSVKDVYNENKMDKLETYASFETLTEPFESLKRSIEGVKKLLGIDMVGGSEDPYYQKYIKYRSKYTSLKEYLQDMQ